MIVSFWGLFHPVTEFTFKRLKSSYNFWPIKMSVCSWKWFFLPFTQQWMIEFWIFARLLCETQASANVAVGFVCNFRLNWCREKSASESEKKKVGNEKDLCELMSTNMLLCHYSLVKNVYSYSLTAQAAERK